MRNYVSTAVLHCQRCTSAACRRTADAPPAGSGLAAPLCSAPLRSASLRCWCRLAATQPGVSGSRRRTEEEEVEQDLDRGGRGRRGGGKWIGSGGGEGGGRLSLVLVQRCQKRLPAARDPPNGALTHQTKGSGAPGLRGSGVRGGLLSPGWPQQAPESSLAAASVLSGPPRGRPSLMPSSWWFWSAAGPFNYKKKKKS